MATGRTKPKWIRVYSNGYDISGYGRSIGPLAQGGNEVELTATMGDTVKGYLKGHGITGAGVYNAVFDNTATTGLHAVMGSADTLRNIIVAYGIRAAPADGDPAFCGGFRQSNYQVLDNAGAVVANAQFAGWDITAATLNYGVGWGQLLHANAEETGANAANGYDNLTAAASAKGGYMVYQVLAGDGTATISVDDSANNAAWLALAGATSGAIDCSNPTSGIIPLGVTATVRQYLRWQLALGTATTVTFVLAFVRG